MGAIKIDHLLQSVDHTIDELSRIAEKLNLGNEDIGELLHEALEKASDPKIVDKSKSIFMYKKPN